MWSPDGSRIAFSTLDASGRWSIYLASADGSRPTGLTAPEDSPGGPANDFGPAWSSDGGRIAFTRSWTYADGHGGCQIFAMNADGSNARQLTQDSFCATSPAWSPDGASIAFNGQIPEARSALDRALSLDPRRESARRLLEELRR